MNIADKKKSEKIQSLSSKDGIAICHWSADFMFKNKEKNVFIGTNKIVITYFKLKLSCIMLSQIERYGEYYDRRFAQHLHYL